MAGLFWDLGEQGPAVMAERQAATADRRAGRFPYTIPRFIGSSCPHPPPRPVRVPSCSPVRTCRPSAGNTDTPGWHFDSGVPGKRVMLSALIHGNELCGAWALKDALAAGLRPRRGSLTLAFCNLAAFDRFDPSNYAPRASWTKT